MFWLRQSIFLRPWVGRRCAAGCWRSRKICWEALKGRAAAARGSVLPGPTMKFHLRWGWNGREGLEQHDEREPEGSLSWVV